MLTDTQTRKLPKSDKYPSLHADINGLYLKHATTGRKTWVYRSRKGSQWNVKKMGDYPALKLNVARAKVSLWPTRYTADRSSGIWWMNFGHYGLKDDTANRSMRGSMPIAKVFSLKPVCKDVLDVTNVKGSAL
jgi:hypothetical protein